MSQAIKERVINTLTFVQSRIREKIAASEKSQQEIVREGEEKIHRFQNETEELKNKLRNTKKMLREKEDEVYGFINNKTSEYAGKIRAAIHRIIEKGVVDGEMLTRSFEDIQESEAESLFDSVFDYINELKLEVEKNIEQYNQVISIEEDINFNPTIFRKAKSTKYEKAIEPIASASGGVAGKAITAKLTATGAALSGPLAPVGALVGFLAGVAICTAAGLAGNKIKKGITKQRGKTTKSEIESSISESEESFKEIASNKFNDFFEKSYEALRQILHNREEQLENLKNDVMASRYVSIEDTLHEDDAFITKKLEDFANV